ncbi:filamentous hemagglutinin N-terminal domain-containing protein [Nostoc sp. CENA67]|uniref:Filamentous hemagglutinin N-terminal domain-containing protein n=1 Tax=Amazonocrinis nigriterrae CENA67 TaxID=2794033 RepID=A0A8J7L8U1_9NOST|nr:filamentous hemagglutinin N-terminal domain-containing protein [Amazonocrinis nigriterrae]MBH8563723.1 filamentous hemagglutinin N-terminal domain-containing protein [Amazonocrinis nigriterrae CENA67]
MTQSGKGCSLQLGLASSLATAGALTLGITSFLANSAFAQSLITPDQNLGTENSQVIKNYLGNPTEALTGGATRGNNLFHSFQEFNVKEGRSALFLIPNSNIQNILVRVTGSNRSEILGKLETSAGSNANLFLINPNGVIFGPNATLNVGGSFVASTASGIKFADDTVFSATAPQTTPLLTVSVPLGLQFERIGGEINLQGKLEVPTGKTLALVGGNVTLDGGNVNLQANLYNLKAPNGQIALGGILGTGTIRLNLDSNNQLLNFPNDVALADVSFINQARISVSGEGGGYVQLQGKRITLNDASEVFADTDGSQNGRGIYIQTEQLTLQNGSQVKASVRENATGSGGSILVRATDSVQVSGTIPRGKYNQGNPSAFFTNTFAYGRAGSLTIETGKLIVENGANISASTQPNSQGKGGNLEVTASEFVKLSGFSAFNNPNGLFAQTRGSGDAGSLTITTPALIVLDGSVVAAGTIRNSSGDGGTLTVSASDYVELSGTAPNGFPSGLYARSQGSGDAGSVYITTGKLIARDNAQVTVGALGVGNAGNLEITTREILLDSKGQLVARTTSGDGGNINLQLENLLQLRNNSQILADAGGGGNGGNITINIPNGLIVAVPEENSDIRANADAGKGGTVNIDAFRVFGIQPRESLTELSDITASSESGPQGNIVINTSDLEPRPELINLLPNQPVEPKVSQVCQAGTAQKKNSFTITGRGGLPANPTEALNTDAVLTDWITLDKVAETSSGVTREKNSTNPSQANIVEATGWVINAKGEVVLTANAPTGTMHNYWQKSSNCSLPQ